MDAHHNLGVALAGQGNVDEAIIHWREAVKLKPEYGQAHHNLAMGLYLKGDMAGAWREVLLCQRYGFNTNPNLARAISEKMRKPNE